MTNWIENKVFLKHQDESSINQCLSKLSNTTGNGGYSFFCSAFQPHPNENYYGDNPLRGWQIEADIVSLIEDIMKKNNIKAGSTITANELQKKLMEELSCSIASWGDIYWGCKYEHQFSQNNIKLINKNEVLVKSFKTAWAPPKLIYQALIKNKYEISAFYKDEKNTLVGIFETNKIGQYQWKCFDYSGGLDKLSEIKLVEFIRGK